MNNKSSLTTIGIDWQTNKLIDKLCKRYSLKKGEIVRLAFAYLDKACINPAEAPESTKAELSRINKRQDDIIRFIRNYEEKELNPMIRAASSVSLRFEKVVEALNGIIAKELQQSRDLQNTVLNKLSEIFNQHADVINKQGERLINFSKIQKRDNQKLFKLIYLYSELAACGVMDGKRKDSLKTEITNLINEQ